MKKLVACLLSVFCSAASAGGGGGGGFAGATEFTQLANLAQLEGQLSIDWEMLAKQAMQLQQEIITAQSQLKNLESNPTGVVLGEVRQYAYRQSKIAGQGFDIANTMASADRDFASVVTNPAFQQQALNFATQYKAWTKSSQEGLKAASLNAGLHKEAMVADADRFSQQMANMAAADGNLKALQALGAINGEQVTQLQSLRELMATQNLAVNKALALKESKDQAKEDAATVRFAPTDQVAKDKFKTPQF